MNQPTAETPARASLGIAPPSLTMVGQKGTAMTNDYSSHSDWLMELNRWIRRVKRWFDKHNRLFRRPRMIQVKCKPRDGYHVTRRKARFRASNGNSRNARKGVAGN